MGYEIPKQKLVDNTEAFVAGRKANNCLLFGDAGTGKSSCIKAIANAYYDRGLRIIEIYKHQFRDLQECISQIKNRNYKFIIYMDDLSFEEHETEYKYLKAVIEGGLEKKPENILIYATSNRRHLIRETWNDRQDMEHHGDISSVRTTATKTRTAIFRTSGRTCTPATRCRRSCLWCTGSASRFILALPLPRSFRISSSRWRSAAG